MEEKVLYLLFAGACVEIDPEKLGDGNTPPETAVTLDPPAFNAERSP